MEPALLHDHCKGKQDALCPAPTPDTFGPSSCPMATAGFTGRSGDDVIDGGHATVPSMGQAMLSLTRLAWASASERSGMVHITPNT
jgi:hypothetical protein